jgi:putative DNA primase/helicase
MSLATQDLDAENIRAALHGIEREIVAAFRGAPNRALSSKKELRWGSKGSLSLQLAGSKAGLWYDHELGRGGDVLSLIMLEQGCDFIAALRFAQQFIGGSAPRPNPIRNIPTLRIVRDDAGDDADELRRIEQAIGIWCDVQPLRGTLAEKYLKSRCIEVPDEALDVLGFHPACPWDRGTVPALVALVRDIITGEAVGIHRTALTPDGGKLGRKVLGPKADGAIKLSGENLVTTELTIAEGIETALSARMFGFRPAWSVIDAGGIARFPVLPHIERLTIIVDNDASGAGQKATAECRARWEAAGHRVRTVMPPTVGDDLNDVLQAQGNQQ